MADIIVADPGQIDFTGTLAELEEIKAIEEAADGKTSLLSLKDWKGSKLEGARVYIPVQKAEDGGEVYVYSELESYPFFQKIKEEIVKAAQPKGVFRLRRIGHCEDVDKRAASDMLALAGFLGELRKVSAKRSKAGMEPQHLIITAVFGEGVLAHLEYTVSGEEEIELEWSGVRRIIEFSSTELGFSPFFYTAESIVAAGRKADKEWVDEWQRILGWIRGGGAE